MSKRRKKSRKSKKDNESLILLGGLGLLAYLLMSQTATAQNNATANQDFGITPANQNSWD